MVRLMLVDDNAVLREQIRRDFTQLGGVEIVAEAGDGIEALDALGRIQADVMLLDIIMPRMDGLSVLGELRERETRPNVLVFTAIGNDAAIARAMDLGASYYMVKPMNTSLLHRRVLEVAGLEGKLPDDRRLPAGVPQGYAHWSVDERVANLFLAIGIPPHIKGYQYLREAVRMVMADRDMINRITKELYPGIARRYDTSSSKVERAMRHAIEVAWSRGRLESTNQMLGMKLFSERDKPTNGEFIALIADKAAGE